MKKAIMIMAAIATTACISGCFTSAYTITETKNADGSSTYSKAKVTGMGDKAAQVAAEGMYSDGTLEDLGAGFKNAQASQESTGIAEAFKGLGGLVGEVARAYTAMQSIPAPRPAPAQQQIQLYDAKGSPCNPDGSPCAPNDGGGTGN